MKIKDKLNNIITGWANMIERPEFFKEIAKERAGKCAECEHNTRLNTCAICSCYIPAKTWSPEDECPEGHWSKFDIDSI